MSQSQKSEPPMEKEGTESSVLSNVSIGKTERERHSCAACNREKSFRSV